MVPAIEVQLVGESPNVIEKGLANGQRLTQANATSFQAGKSQEESVAGMTAVWQYGPDLFWKMHEVVREANPHWKPTEGNEPSA
jgi:hypothetical protein